MSSLFFVSRLLCALEGNYLDPEADNEVEEHVDGADKDDKLQSLNFTCSVPAVAGRGFIEVDLFLSLLFSCLGMIC